VNAGRRGEAIVGYAPPGFDLREAEEADVPDIHALIGGVYAEYGFPFDLNDDAERHIRAPHSWFRDHDGAFFVLREGDASGPLVATVGYSPFDVAAMGVTDGDDDLVGAARRPVGEDLNVTVTYRLSVEPDDLADAIELRSLYVTKQHRRRGLATGLVRLIDDRARAAGASRVILWTDTDLLGAHSFYEDLGFRHVGLRETRGMYDFDELGYVRELAARL
jgi:GNAT superfamily N-acetyltransferase